MTFREALLLLKAVQGSECFDHHGLIRRAEFILQVGKEFAEACELEFVAHGLVHECTDSTTSCSFAQFLDEILFNGHR